MNSISIGCAAVALALYALPAAAASTFDAPSMATTVNAAQTTAAPYDPWEPMNRRLFKFNKGLDHAIIRPGAIGYKTLVPRPVRTGIGNALNNLGEPDTAINDILQIHLAKGATATTRFVINTTVGVLGLFDVAKPMGLPRHDSDFGQTLGHYGVKPGPYLYVPFFGPTDLRDGVGRIADGFASPLNLHDLHVPIGAKIGVIVLDGINTRAELDDLLEDLARTATDEYAAQRSVFLQNRQAQIADPHKAVEQLPDFDTPASPPKL